MGRNVKNGSMIRFDHSAKHFYEYDSINFDVCSLGGYLIISSMQSRGSNSHFTFESVMLDFRESDLDLV